jgi:hypothetical protein
MNRRLTRLLTALAAVAAAGGIGFTTTTMAAAEDDPVAEVDRMHEEMPPSSADPTTASHDGGDMDIDMDMDDMHAEMSRRLRPEDRPRHDRMHEACTGHDDERTAT